MPTFDLNRAGDIPITTLKVASITPKEWPTLPIAIPAGEADPVFVRSIAYEGGAEGDDVSQSTANVAYASNGAAGGSAEDPDYSPKTQSEKATDNGNTLAVDITTPRGWIDPKSPAKAKPAAPTLTTIAPTTAATGGGTIPVTLTGTGFTRYSTVKTGGVITPYVEYVSPTSLKVILDPRSSPGSIDISVIDHSVETAPQAFTFTAP